jgi:protein-tyrosine phosphatase
MQKNILIVLALGVLAAFSGCGSANRASSLDTSDNGFAVYRSGQPEAKDIEDWCKLGVTKIFALNGQAGRYFKAIDDFCGGKAKVEYNHEQDPDTAVTKEFLDKFDGSVAAAQASGEKILFHCYCGCHRTGRLAAYYRMKYQNWPAEKAIEEMMGIGKDMDNHPSLSAQVYAMQDHIQGRPCTQKAEYCIR